MSELVLGIVLKTTLLLSVPLAVALSARHVGSATRVLISMAALLTCCFAALAEVMLPHETSWAPPLVVSIAPPVSLLIDQSMSKVTNPIESGPVFDYVRVLWLGCGVFVVGVLGSVLRTYRAIGRLATVTDVHLRDELRAVQEELGCAKTLRFVWQDLSRSSFTFGCWPPVVGIPEDFGSWTQEKRKAALMHEISHVQRSDFLALTIARLIVGLLWWQPLAWAVLRLLKQDIERACDDRVLMSGLLPKRYAQYLVDTSRPTSRKPVLGPVVQMAAPSALKLRIGAIIDGKQRRSPMTKVSMCCVTAGYCALAFLLASSEVVQADSKEDRHYIPVYKTMPVYPREAQEARIEGWVLLEFDVNAQGETTNIEIVDRSNALFDQAARDAVSKFHYLPERVAGKTVAVEGVRNKVTFALNEDGRVANDELVQSVQSADKQQFEVQREIEAAAWQADADQDGDRFLELARMAVDQHPTLASYLLLKARAYNANDKAGLVLVTGMTFFKLGDLDSALSSFSQLAKQQNEHAELARRWQMYVEREVVRRKVVHQELVEGV